MLFVKFANQSETRRRSNSILAAAAKPVMEQLEGRQLFAVNSITALETAFVENFNSMAAGTSLPAGSGFTINGGTSVIAASGSYTTGGAYNFVGATGDRAIGVLNSGSYTTGKVIQSTITNNSGSTITSLDIGWNYEKYRSGSRAWSWAFTAGGTANAAGSQSYAADGGNTTYGTPLSTTPKSLTVSGLNIAQGATYVLSWTLNGTGGSTNGQGLGIDDVTITAHGAPPATSAPTITTPTSASITQTTAALGGNVTSDGGAAITSRGVVYSLTSNDADPNIGDSGVLQATTSGTTGVFTVPVTGLVAGSSYSYKAYATNAEGTTYTTVGTFNTQAADSPGTIAIDPASISVSEGGNATFTVTRTGGASGEVSVSFAINVGTATIADLGSPTPSTTITFADNDSASKTISIPIIDDSDAEGSEQFTVTLGSPTNGATLGNATGTATIAASDQAPGTIRLINELNLNPAGTDAPYEYVELRGTPGASIGANTFLVFVEADSATARGAVDGFLDLSSFTFGSNGLFIIRGAGGATVPAGTNSVDYAGFATGGSSPLENGAVTVLLIESPTAPVIGTDYDSNNDGAFDAATVLANATIVDGVGLRSASGDASYSVANLFKEGVAADAATRFVDNDTANSGSAWYWGQRLPGASGGLNSDNFYTTDTADLSDNFPAGGAMTPGAANVGNSGAVGSVISISRTPTGASVDENAGTITYTVTRTNPTADAVTLDVIFTGTASGADYNVSGLTSGQIIIPANQASATFTIAIVDDTDNEAAETIIATISSSALPLNHTINSAANSSTLSINASDAPTGGGVHSILNQGPFSQDWTNTDSAISTANVWTGVPGIVGYRGDDLVFTNNDPRTVVAFSGSPAGPVVNINPDTTDTAVLSGGLYEFDGLADPVVAFQGSGTGDAPFFLIEVDTQGVSSVNVKYLLRKIDADTATQPVALQYRIGNSGNFTNIESGYVANANVAGGTQVDVNLTEIGNAALVQLRIITVNVPGNDALIGVDNIVVQQTPLTPGTFAFSSATFNQGENILNGGQNVARVQINRTGGSTGAVRVPFTIADGTGVVGSDYTLPTNLFVDFADGQATAFVDVPLINDSVLEANETFTITLQQPVSIPDAVPVGSLGAVATTTVSIINDDGAPTGVLLNEIVVNPVGDDAGYEFIELRGTPGTTLDDVFFVSIEGDDRAGLADLVISLDGVTFGSNGLIMIKGTGGFTPADSATTIVTSAALDTTGGILENGSNAFALFFSSLPITQGTDFDTNGDGTLDLPSHVTNLDSVGWLESGDAPETNSAYAGAVLTQAAGTPDAASRFPGNNTANSAAAWYNGDLVALASETPTASAVTYDPDLERSANFPEGGIVTPGGSNAPVVGPGTISLANATVTVNESDNTVTITVNRTGGSLGAVSIDYATANGTAEAGLDYTSASGTLSWADGDNTPKTFTVAILNDTDVEASQTFVVNLTNPQNSTNPSTPPVVGTSSETVTIVSEDIAPVQFVQFDQTSYAVDEAAGTVTVTVTRNGNIGGPIGPVSIINSDLSSQMIAEGDMVAGAPTGWTSSDVASTSTWNPLSGSFTIEPTGNVITIDTAGGTGAVTVSQQLAATLQANTTYQLSVDVGLPAGAGFPLDIVREYYNDNTGTTASVTYNGGNSYTFDDGAGFTTTGTRTGNNIALNVGGSVEIQNDSTLYFPEIGSVWTPTTPVTSGAQPRDFSIELWAGGLMLGSFGGTPSSGQLSTVSVNYTSTSSDPIGQAIEVRLVGAAVSGSTFRQVNFDNVSLTADPQFTPASVQYTIANGTADSGSDYSATNLTGTLTFAEGEDSKSIVIDINNDTIVEPTETFTVTLSNPNSGTGITSTNPVSIQITDNDVSSLPAWLGEGSVADWNDATNTLTVTGPTTIIDDPATFGDSPIIIGAEEDADIVISTGNGPGAARRIHIGGLTLSNGADLTLASVTEGRSASNHYALIVANAAAESFAITGISKLDLNDNDLILRGGASIASVHGLIASGRGEGFTWDGAGIMSGAAATGSLFGATGLGVMLNDIEGNGTPYYTEWMGETGLSANDIIVKFTWYGDADLNGEVTDFDFALTELGYQDGGSGMFYGDFDMNGDVDDFDFALLELGYTSGGQTSVL